MIKTDPADNHFSLRQRAEQRLLKKTARRSSEGEKNKLLHELYVHQIELEMQNNELNEAKLAQDEALNHYIELFEFAPIAYFVLNSEAEIISANLTATTLFDTPRAKLIGMKLTHYISSSLRHRLTKALTGVFDLRKKASFELTLTIGSALLPLWVNVELKREHTGGFCLVAMNDITLRKVAEVEMQLISAVYSSLSEAVMVIDKHNRVTTLNPSFTTLTGYSENEMLGQSPTLLKSDKHTLEFYLQLFELLEQTGKWQGEIYARRKNGEDVILSLSVSSIYDVQHSMSHYVATFTDISEKKHAADTILTQANFDMLTGLPNRRLFLDRLEQYHKKAVRDNSKLALLTLDIDNFKSVNDSLGHQLGDELLSQAAVRITDCIRDSDTLARLGGDEFSIIITELDEAVDIDYMIHRLLETMAEPFVLGDSFGYVSISVGVAIFPTDANEINHLLRSSDNAMYVAKQEGRNRVHYFTPLMQEEINRKLYVSSELRDVLTNNQLSIVYQPIVNLLTNHTLKAEALVRWQHPVLGSISPSEFIPIAEENGLIITIGEWIFKQVADQALVWCNEYCSDFQITVNKSPIQFGKSYNQKHPLVDYLTEIGLGGHAIVVEITEGLLMDASKQITQRLKQLNEAGIKVALDDFGTGFSSLAYLKKFQVDYIKIDKSFIKDLKQDSDEMAICEAIIVMAHKLGIKVIAEGIETQKQHDLLHAVGCDYGQGYLFSKPVPANEFELLLDK